MTSAAARFAVILLVASASPFLTGVSSAGAQDPSAREIIDLAVERAQEQAQAQPEMSFEVIVEAVTEFLDGDQQVEKVERETYRQYPLEGVLYEELIAKEGLTLDDDDARDELERREEFAENVRKRREQGESPVPEDENRVEFNQEFVDRYVFSIVGEEEINGHPSWIIYLEPREGDLPVRRRIDHALNKSTGRIWVSKEDYGLPRVEFEMREPVRFWGGILGSLRDTVGRLDFTRVEDGAWMPTSMDIRFDVRILFASIRRRMIREWGEYTRWNVAE